VLLLVLALGCAVLAAQAFLYATAPSLYPTAIRASASVPPWRSDASAPSLDRCWQAH